MKMTVCVKDMGSISIELWPELAPLAISKVKHVTEIGAYDGLKIERLEPGFVIQPVFSDEAGTAFEELIELEAKTIKANGEIPFERGIVAMAGTPDQAAAAQYFITLAKAERLNGNFTVIGKVIDGWDVVEKIESTPVVQGDVEEDGEVFHFHYPETDIIIEKVIVE